MNLFIPPAMDWIVWLLFFYKEGFVIKYPTKVDMPSKKETQLETLQLYANYFFLDMNIRYHNCAMNETS